MPRYAVVVTRDLTESTTIEVDAPNEEAAEEAALTKLYNSDGADWEIDDGSWNEGGIYVTDVGLAHNQGE